MTFAFTIRKANADDAGALLQMMRQLAEFEAYAKQFCVTEQDLLERGLASQSPQFTALVAENIEGQLIGYAAVYQVDFTYDLRPNLHLKELFINQECRHLGIGKALMQAVISEAKARNCGRLKWDVLPKNHRAKAFYQSFNAQPVHDWEAWILKF